MSKLCPACQSPLTLESDKAPHCDHCGYHPSSISREPSIGYDPIPIPQAPQPPHGAPQPIINHHTSSQYNRRLESRLESLETLELPPVVDPSQELEAPDTEPIQASDQSGEDAEIKPSAYIVNATQPITPSKQSEQERATDLLAQAREFAHHSKRPAPTASSPYQAAADALLLQHQSPEKHPPRRNIVLIALSIILLLGAAIASWFLLHTPDATPPSASTQSSSPPAPTTQASDGSTRDKQRKDDLNTIAIGLETYRTSTGAYPVGNDITILAPLQNTTPPFITKLNRDPLSTDATPIQYSYSSDGTAFTLSATLENRLDPDAKDGLYIVRSKNGT